MLILQKYIKNQRHNAWSIVETIVATTCALWILLPSSNFLFNQMLNYSNFQACNSIELQSEYILKLMEDELRYSHYTSDWIPSECGQKTSLLAFVRQDGVYVRYYLRGQEIVKDHNYSVSNAISPRMFQSFRIKRKDYDHAIILTAKIKGNNNHVYQQSWIIKKPKT